MAFVYVVGAGNDTLGDSVPDEDWSLVKVATYVSDGIGLCFTLFGFLFNYFCFITADHLPVSTSATLMKYVAVWDTMNCLVKIGVLNTAMTSQIELQWETYTVSKNRKTATRLNYYIYLKVSVLIFWYKLICQKDIFSCTLR